MGALTIRYQKHNLHCSVSHFSPTSHLTLQSKAELEQQQRRYFLPHWYHFPYAHPSPPYFQPHPLPPQAPRRSGRSQRSQDVRRLLEQLDEGPGEVFEIPYCSKFPDRRSLAWSPIPFPACGHDESNVGSHPGALTAEHLEFYP